MRHVRALAARIAALFTADRADDDLREELQAHLDMETAEYIRRGMPPGEARRKALISSGGLTQAAEAVRAQRRIPWVDGLALDIRYALRSLRHAPAFTSVVMLTLALGIGANTAIFSVVSGVLLKPLPHREGDRLVYLRKSVATPGDDKVLFSVPEVRDLRAGASALAAIAEYSPWFFTLRGAHGAERIEAGLVTGNFFEVMGLSPALGRLIGPGDDGAGAKPVMVLTHEFWVRRFRGDPAIIGTMVTLNESPAMIVGVLRPAPYFPDRMDAFLNTVASEHHMSALMADDRVHRMTEAIGRLAPGASLASARAQVDAANARMEAAHPSVYGHAPRYRVAVVPFKEAIGSRARLTLWMLMGAAAFVMIISVANVVNLTLMRGVRREPELVIRAALGAGTARLRRLLLAENILLALAGAVAGLLVAIAGVRLLVPFVERFSPRANEIRLDLTVLGFAVALSAVVALVLSHAAFLPGEGALGAMVSAGGRRMSGGMRRQALQRALVVAQVAASVVLLAGAGLLTRTMLRLADVSTGLSTEEVLTMSVTLTNPARLTPASSDAAKVLYERMRREIGALPGVIEVGLGSSMPLRAPMLDFDVKAEGAASAGGGVRPHADFRTASPEYFRAAGIPFVKGREFSRGDSAGAPRVAIVNQALADLFFRGQDPVGRRIAWTGDVLRFAPVDGGWRTIVGVVGNTRDGGLDAALRPAAFMPFAQEIVMRGGLVIRADRDAAALAPAATAIVRRAAPSAPVEQVMTVRQIKDQSVAPRRLNAALLSLFGVLATLVAAVGIAGVLAFSVSARTNEIGIRMSLGADARRVQWMILKEGGALLAAGLLLGIAGALVAANSLRAFLFGVTPRDPATFIAVPLLVAVVGIVACWIPARRASRIDPATAMRA